MLHGMGLDIRSRYLLFVLLSAKFALILDKMQNHSKIHQLQFSAATIHAFIKKTEQGTQLRASQILLLVVSCRILPFVANPLVGKYRKWFRFRFFLQRIDRCATFPLADPGISHQLIMMHLPSARTQTQPHRALPEIGNIPSR